MPALAHHPTTPAPERPAPRPTSCGSDPPKAPPAPAPAADAEEPRTFLRVLLRALGALHT
jgi:hypothetical protein